MSDEDRATLVTDLVGRGYITVLDGDGEPTDEVDEYDEDGGGRFRSWRVGGVSFEYAPERTHAPLHVEEEDATATKTELRPVDGETVGVEASEFYRVRGVALVLDTAFRHPENDSLRFKVTEEGDL